MNSLTNMNITFLGKQCLKEILAEEEDVTYSKEELDEIVREGEETLREAREGKLKGYKTDEELFKALGI